MARDTEKLLWYLSFADEAGWLGACYVAAWSAIAAVETAHLHHCNPGGEVVVVELPPHVTIPPEDRNRLLTKAEVEGVAGEPLTMVTGSVPDNGHVHVFEDKPS